MKKSSKTFLMSFALLTLICGAGIRSQAASLNEDGMNDISESIIVTITNDLTGESAIVDEAVVEMIFEIDQTTPLQRLTGELSFSQAYEVFVPLEAFGIEEEEFDSLTSRNLQQTVSPNGAGASATLGVDYSTKTGQINVTRAWGNWKPKSGFYVTDRSWGVSTTLYPNLTSGQYSTTGKPTTDSFTKSITWGWVDHLKNDLSPRAYSEATVRVTGMTATYTLTVEFRF